VIQYLSAKDIALEMNVSPTKAYKILKECPRIVAGRTVRVSRGSFEAWKRRHEHGPSWTEPEAAPPKMRDEVTASFAAEYAALLAPSRPRRSPSLLR
jgi:hypothetical protein